MNLNKYMEAYSNKQQQQLHCKKLLIYLPKTELPSGKK